MKMFSCGMSEEVHKLEGRYVFSEFQVIAEPKSSSLEVKLNVHGIFMTILGE
jgi:hypothetical protein